MDQTQSLTSLPRQQKLSTQPEVWPLPKDVSSHLYGCDGDPLTVSVLSLQCKQGAAVGVGGTGMEGGDRLGSGSWICSSGEAFMSRDPSHPSCLNAGKSCFEYESGGGNGILESQITKRDETVFSGKAILVRATTHLFFWLGQRSFFKCFPMAPS